MLRVSIGIVLGSVKPFLRSLVDFRCGVVVVLKGVSSALSPEPWPITRLLRDSSATLQAYCVAVITICEPHYVNKKRVEERK